jgi:PAS domain S-box-containing protein
VEADALAGLDDLTILSTIVDRLTDVVFVLGDDDLMHWRRRSSRLRVHLPDNAQVLGIPMLERVHPADLPSVLDTLEQMRLGHAPEATMRVRIFDANDPSIIHDEDLRAFDARDVPGVGGIVVAVEIRDTRGAFPHEVHGDDFSIADVAPIGLAVLATGDRIIYANALFREHLGLEGRVAITVTSVQGLHEAIAGAREGGVASAVVTHRGRTLRVVGRRIADNGTTSIALSTTDITAEHQAMVALARSQETWRATFEHAPAGIALVDPAGRFLEINRAWTAITGYEPSELIGRSFADITHPDDIEPDLALVRELLDRRQRSYRLPKRYVHRDGHVVSVDLWCSIVRDDAGEPVHFVAQILEQSDAAR